jgi:hypothetical protein
MGWFLRLSCVVIVVFGIWFLWEWVTFYSAAPEPTRIPEHRSPRIAPPTDRSIHSVTPFPVDHVTQRLAI